jgi:hypothetical protein
MKGGWDTVSSPQVSYLCVHCKAEGHKRGESQAGMGLQMQHRPSKLSVDRIGLEGGIGQSKTKGEGYDTDNQRKREKPDKKWKKTGVTYFFVFVFPEHAGGRSTDRRTMRL